VNTYIELHRAVRLFQERNRFVADAQGTGLSLLESRLLTDISLCDSVTLSDLCRDLSLTPVVVSRTLSGLKKSKLIRMVSDPKDARRRFLRLTERGVRVLADLDRRADARLEQFVSNLSEAEYGRFKRYMSIFADGLGVPVQAYTRSEHVLRKDIRRITQGLGLLTNRVYECDDLSSVEWHILAKLGEQSHSILAKTIVAAFSIPPNTVAGIMQRLLRRRLIVRTVDARDRRQLVLGLSAKGKELLEEIEAAAALRLRGALQQLNDEQVRDFTSLMMAMIGVGAPTLLSPNGELLECVEVTDGSGHASVRTFCAEQLVRCGKASMIGERFYASDSRCFVLRHGQQLFACVEAQEQPGQKSTLSLTHLAHVESLDELPILDTFLDLVARSLTESNHVARICVSIAWLRNGAQPPAEVSIE